MFLCVGLVPSFWTMGGYSRTHLLPLLLAFRSQKRRVFCSFSSGSRDMVESPELPDWFKNPQGNPSDVCSDDEFVLPTKLEVLEDRSSNLKANGSKADIRVISHDIVGCDADVDEICCILRSNSTSPETVFLYLDGCSVKISQQLVNKILHRFSNDWISAFGFFMWAGAQISYKHPAVSYDMMIDILGKFKQFCVMWGLIEEMAQLGDLVSLATMTKVMRRLAGAGRWNDAINAFNDMEHFGVKKDTIAMNVLLDTLCKERSVMRARDAFLKLRSEIPPDASSFNCLVHGWCKAQKLDEARQTMKEMQEFGFRPCVITYTSLIEAYCLERNFRMVDAVLNEMRSEGCPPNVVTYTIVMHALGKAKKTQEAFEIFDKMKDDCIPDTSFYNSLIYILSRAGRLHDANNIFEEMCKNGISRDVTTYNTLISASCDHSQEEDALKLLANMEESACKPDIKTYTPLLKLCYKKHWMKILYFLLAHMFRKDISPDFSTYTLLVNGLCRNGKLTQSCLFFEEMVLKGLVPKQDTYNNLIEALERMHMYGPKIKVQKLMLQTKSVKPSGQGPQRVLVDKIQIGQPNGISC